LYPGDAGVMAAVEKAFGPRARHVAAWSLLGAVAFGAVAILIVAGEYAAKVTPFSANAICAAMMAFCLLMLLKRITILGRVVSVLSTVSAVLLFCGAVATLGHAHRPIVIAASFVPMKFAYALLLLFWTTLGWEVLGNYSAEVRDPATTIPRSAMLSAVAIACVELLVAAAVQWGKHAGNGMTGLIAPLFGVHAAAVMAMLTGLLCCSTYLLYGGGTSRLVASMAEEGALPKVLATRCSACVPRAAVIAIGAVNVAVLGLVVLGVFNVESLVAIANLFFVVNVSIGFAAGVFILRRGRSDHSV